MKKRLFFLIVLTTLGYCAVFCQKIRNRSTPLLSNAIEYMTIAGRLQHTNIVENSRLYDTSRTGNNEQVSDQFDNLLNSYGTLGWDISTVLEYKIKHDTLDKSNAPVLHDELFYKIILKRATKTEVSTCNTTATEVLCELQGEVWHCKGTILLDKAQGGDAFRSKSILIPKFKQIDEIDFYLCNKEDQFNTFSVYSTKINLDFNSTQSQISINALSVRNKPAPNKNIYCTYEIWGIKGK